MTASVCDRTFDFIPGAIQAIDGEAAANSRPTPRLFVGNKLDLARQRGMTIPHSNLRSWYLPVSVA
jgi:hypothetical protein